MFIKIVKNDIKKKNNGVYLIKLNQNHKFSTTKMISKERYKKWRVIFKNTTCQSIGLKPRLCAKN